MAKGKAIKIAAVPAPQNLQEAEECVAQIGRVSRMMDNLNTRMTEEMEKVRKRYLPQAHEIEEDLLQLLSGLQAYAAAHRRELTEGKTKTVKLRTGEFAWRQTPPAVNIRDIKTVLKTLEELELTRFIRLKPEINKKAILAEPDAVKGLRGVSITQHEDFVVKPAAASAEIAVRTSKGGQLKFAPPQKEKKPAAKKTA